MKKTIFRVGLKRPINNVNKNKTIPHKNYKPQNIPQL